VIENKTFTVEKSGDRFDVAVLAKYPSSSRAFVREAIESGNITVNGSPSKKGRKLHAGEVVSIISLAEEFDNTPIPDASFKPLCVFEDDFMLAYDKPAGMPVQPISRTETGTLMNAVVAQHPECLTLGDRPLMAGALHRIDAGTSGLVLVARTKDAFENVRKQFSSQTVEKKYLALVEGRVTFGGTLENHLVHDPRLQQCKMIDIKDRIAASYGPDAFKDKALHAVTHYNPIGYAREENEDRTLLEVTIFTGVTHQIRAQLAIAGMHIINDRLYGAFAVENMTGHCLHSLSAKFKHPATGETTIIQTQYPKWAIA
jgi:23S rRNA pseudouridine1911/1915/1917 synthase